MPEKPNKPAGPIRSRIHAWMLQLDEWICNRLPFPPCYDLPDDNSGWQIRDMLEALAIGKIQARYANGLAVPRSLFFNRFAVLLLSADKGTRGSVTTPYGFRSSENILVPGDTNAKLNAPVTERKIV